MKSITLFLYCVVVSFGQNNYYRTQVVNQTALVLYREKRNTSSLCEYLHFLC